MFRMRYRGLLSGNGGAAAVSPTANFTVPAGQIWKGYFALDGIVTSGSGQVEMRLEDQGGTIYHIWGQNSVTIGSGSIQCINSGEMTLGPGNYRIKAGGNFSAANGTVYYMGTLYSA